MFIKDLLKKNLELETTNMLRHRSMARQIVVRAYHGTVLHGREEPAKDTAAWLDLKGMMLKGKKAAH